MVNPQQLPHGNTAFGRLWATLSPMPTGSSTPAVEYPQASMAEQLERARTSHRLSPYDLNDFSQDTLSTLSPRETATLTLFSQLVRALLTVLH